MSAATPAGAISIQAVLDLSQVNAQLAALRSQGYTMPIRGDFVGPGGNSTFTGPAGPASFATFANRGGTVMPNLGAMLAAAGGNTANAAVGPTGTQQLTNAMQQLTQAIQGMTQGAGGGAAGASGAGAARPIGPGGSNRILGLRAGGLMRYVGAGFIAREALGLVETVQGYQNETLLAGNDSRRQLANEQQFIKKIPLGGLFGASAQTQNNLTTEIADRGEDFMRSRLAMQREVISARQQATNAGFIGSKRQIADAEYAAAQRKVDIQKQFFDPVEQKKAQDFDNAERAAVLLKDPDANVFMQLQDKGAQLAPEPLRRANSLRDRLATAESDANNRRIRRELPMTDLLDASDKRLKAEKDIIQAESARQRDEWKFDTKRNSLSMVDEQLGRGITGPDFGRIRSNELERIGAKKALIQEESGSAAAIAYGEYAISELNLQDNDRHRRAVREGFSIRSATERMNIISGNDRASQGEYPGTRRALGELQSIISSTESNRQSIIEEFGSDTPESEKLRHENAMEGRAQLVAFRQQFQDSIHGVSVNPFTQSLSGVGGANEQKIRQQIDRAFNKVGNESAIGKDDSGGGGSKEVAMNTKDAVTKLDQIYTKINDFISRFA